MDKFFCIVIEAMVVILYIHIADYSTINKFQILIARFDWPTIISKVKHDYLKIFIFQCIRNKVSIKINITVASMLETKKRE